MPLKRKFHRFVKRLRRSLSWNHNRLIWVFYTAVLMFTAQVTLTTFYSCAKGDFLCETEEVYVQDKNIMYSDFSPRLYKNEQYSNEHPLRNFVEVKKNVNRIKYQSKLNISQTGNVSILGNETSMLQPPETLPRCPFMPPNLKGNIYVNTEVEYNFGLLEKLFDYLEDGGQYTPPDCLPRHKIAIIVPYRNRKYHLSFFFKHMHSFLRRQQVYYRIFVVEIEPKSKFNKGLLFNAGFVEASRIEDFDCYIFHDVDLLPENDFNMYRCWSHSPRHLSVAVDSLKYKLVSDSLIGGVNAMTKEQIELVNGYSNKFYGWGGEDDDLYNRIKDNHMVLSRLTNDVARYKMLKHPKREPNPTRWELLKLGMKRWKQDGLNTLKYTVINREYLKLCTYILIDYNITDPAFKEDVFLNKQVKETDIKNKEHRDTPLVFGFLFIAILIIIIITIMRQ